MLPKRIWAMMGVVYVLIITLLMVYWMATMQLISGITGIMMFPAFGALCAQFLNRDWIYRHGREGHVEEPDFQEPPLRPHSMKELSCAALCGAASLCLLALGISQLIQYFHH